MTKNIAIVVARGGSKRIPRKNIRNFCGRPIIAYSIQAAIESKCFSEVMVSTDDKEIASVARQYGATVPFFRTEQTSNDYATTDDVIAEVLGCYETSGIRFDCFCCIYPTAPFITSNLLREAMNLLKEHDSVFPVVKYSYPPQRAFVIRGGKAKRWMPEYQDTRSQDIEPLYHDAGQFYACRTQAFLSLGTTDLEDTMPIILSEMKVQDIDTEEDWAIAEEKYRNMCFISTNRNSTY